MQKVEIIFDEVIERSILMLLRQNGIEHYTKLEKVKGVGSSGMKFDDAVGPGANKLIFTILPEEKAENLVRSFKKFKEIQKSAGAKLIISPVSQFL